jgi:hypothetical protein
MTHALAAVLLALAAAPAAAQGLAMTTCQAELAVAEAECLARATRALGQRLYGAARRVDGGVAVDATNEAAAILCTPVGERTNASVVLARAVDAQAECRTLLGLLTGQHEPGLRSAHFAIEPRPDGKVVVAWHDTPGDDGDWLAVQPADAPDNTYSLFWTYTGGRKSGQREIGPLGAGVYEARLYFDWPNGGYVVRDRLRFALKGH